MNIKQPEILFINSPLVNKKLGVTQEDYIPPLGMAYVISALRQKGFTPQFLDAIGRDIPTYAVHKEIEKLHPEIVGINIFSTNKKEVLQIIQTFCNRIKFLVGGAGVKGLEKEILSIHSSKGIDVVIGDGELIVPDLISGIEKQKEVTLEHNNRLFVIDKQSPYFSDNIDNTVLQRDFLDFDGLSQYKGSLEACIVATRGCIYNCAFCGSAISRNSNPSRVRSIESIKNEIQNIVDNNSAVSSVRFIDDLFLRNKESILSAIQLFSSFPNVKWRAMAHINTFKDVSPEVLTQLKNSGCQELFIGIESGSPRILKKIHKISDIVVINDVVRNILRAKIEVKGYFIYGFPDETIEDIEKTYSLAFDLKKISQKYKTSFRVSVFRYRPYEGTELFDIIGKKINIVHDQTLSNKLDQRAQFNFIGDEKISSVDENIIQQFINQTMELNNQ